MVRRLWPARYRRSDVYRKLVRLENRHRVAARIDRLRGRPARERVVQDVEIPLDRTADFLRWFAARACAMTPVWLCPLRLREPAGVPAAGARPGRCTRCAPGGTTSTSASGGPCRSRRAPPTATSTGTIERDGGRVGGHKSLYSDAYYDRDDFDRLYGGDTWRAVKDRYDPDDRLLDLYEKAVSASMS